MATAAKKVVKKVRIDTPPSARPVTSKWEDGSMGKTVKGQNLTFDPDTKKWRKSIPMPPQPKAVRKNTKKAAR